MISTQTINKKELTVEMIYKDLETLIRLRQNDILWIAEAERGWEGWLKWESFLYLSKKYDLNIQCEDKSLEEIDEKDLPVIIVEHKEKSIDQRQTEDKKKEKKIDLVIGTKDKKWIFVELKVAKRLVKKAEKSEQYKWSFNECQSAVTDAYYLSKINPKIDIGGKLVFIAGHSYISDKTREGEIDNKEEREKFIKGIKPYIMEYLETEGYELSPNNLHLEGEIDESRYLWTAGIFLEKSF